MNTIATFDNTVSVLVKAYFEGTLEGMHCAACACGNIIASANKLTIVPADMHFTRPRLRFVWAEYIDAIKQEGGRDPHSIWSAGKTTIPNPEKLIANTGYSTTQLCTIEDAFMGWNDGGSFGDNLQGLLRVVDVLADIHGIDLTAAEAAKSLFVKA